MEQEDLLIEKIALDFLTADRILFEVGDPVMIIEKQYEPLGLFGKRGKIEQKLGRGWYAVRMDDGNIHRFYVGQTWTEIEPLETVKKTMFPDQPTGILNEIPMSTITQRPNQGE